MNNCVHWHSEHLLEDELLRNLTNQRLKAIWLGHVAQSVGHPSCKRGPGFDTWSGHILSFLLPLIQPGHVAQSVGHLTRKSEVLGSITGLATYFRFPFL